jgi:hypothetical protein
MLYRELLLSSDTYTRGDKNHPFFQFPEAISVNKFFIRSAEIPNFWWNLPADESLTLNVYNSAGAVVATHTATVVANRYHNTPKIAGILNTAFTTALGAIWDVHESFYIFVTTDFTVGTADHYKLDFTGSPYLQKLFGSVSTVSQAYDVSSGAHTTEFTKRHIGALKGMRDNYILLKSGAASGMVFTPNITASGSHASTNILAKIPINPATFGNESYIYQENDAPNLENMFNFNSSQLANLDLYCTRPWNDDPLDFNGLNFSVTIGIIAGYYT